MNVWIEILPTIKKGLCIRQNFHGRINNDKSYKTSLFNESKSPESRRKVAGKSPESRREVAGKSPESRRKNREDNSFVGGIFSKATNTTGQESVWR